MHGSRADWKKVAIFLALFGLCLSVFLFSTNHAQASTCFEAPEGLVSWWPGDGNAEDIAGTHTGALKGGASFAAGKVDQAFKFDGIDDFVEVLDVPSLTMGTGDLTVVAWVNTSDPTQNHRFVDTGARRDEGYSLYYFSPQFFGLPGTGSTSVQWRDGGPPPDVGPSRQNVGSGVDIADGVWHLIVGVWDRDTSVSNYLDGVLANSALPQFSASENISNAFNLRIGSEAAEVRQLSNGGLIDEVQIYNRPLLPAEILGIYQAGSAGTCKDEDGDGFRPPDDCDETNLSINPDAAEIPFNFVDENCDGNLGQCDPCAAWPNHGAYVRCVSDAVSDCSVSSFTPEEANGLVNSASHSEIGKKGFVPPECQP